MCVTASIYNETANYRQALYFSTELPEQLRYFAHQHAACFIPNGKQSGLGF